MNDVYHNAVQPISPSWEDVYHANLMNALLAPDMELISHSFFLNVLRDAENDRVIQNPARGHRSEFCRLLADWIISGQTLVSEEMIALNPNAARFGTYCKETGIVTAYGPRIAKQLRFVVEELQANPNSRRACIMMLGSDDQRIAEALAGGLTNCEYLCTYAFNFRLRHGRLDMVTSMRSNNYVTTVTQDVYVFARLQEHVAGLLGVPCGGYWHHTVSGHVLEADLEKAFTILTMYYNSYLGGMEVTPPWHQANGWPKAWQRFTKLALERRGA